MPFRQLTVRSAPLLVLLGLVAAWAPSADAAADDFRLVEGVLTAPLQLPESEVGEISGRDGVLYYVDLRRLPRESLHVPAQTVVTVIGFEGERPDVIAAQVLKFQDSVPPLIDDRQPVDLRVISGTVQAMSGQSLTLKSADGRPVTVEIGSLFGGSSPLLSRGEHVEVLGVLTEDNTFAANALILQAPGPRGGRRR